ncbi:hypothetical protein FFLO_05414 [Filobasidium floriforme]|uniref:DUF6699 domain-containing protein n=1 Tax=Filobasidium floriforme TaxID=5210 RepID=A0A8K0NNZ4_9TREE|nr:hypothetical protein FFLO_05414 [Filobasidium floriforme]
MSAAPPTLPTAGPPPTRKKGIALHPWQPGPGHSQILTYLQAGMHSRALKLHPLLDLTMWDPKVERNRTSCKPTFLTSPGPLPPADRSGGSEQVDPDLPAYAVIWIDEEAQETELVGERDHAATQPRVEELYCCHAETGWVVRVRNRGGVTVNDVLHAISPLYVDEMMEMHPRGVRIMEQRYFEARAMFGGMAPGMGMFDGYRKADALLGRTFFNGIKWDPQVLADRYFVVVAVLGTFHCKNQQQRNSVIVTSASAMSSTPKQKWGTRDLRPDRTASVYRRVVT